MVTDLIKTKYSSGNFNNCIVARCQEGCKLKDIPNNYLILDGDKIEECNGRTESLPSCDCIILKNIYHNKVLLIELRRGQIKLRKAKEKFKNSGEEIMNAIHEYGYNFPSLCPVLLGKIEDSGLKSRDKEFWVNGKYCSIKVFQCGSSFNDITGFIN